MPPIDPAAWIRIVTFLAIATGAVAAAAGLFWTPPGDMPPAPDHYGQGLYRRDTAFTAGGAQGADLVTLILILSATLWALAGPLIRPRRIVLCVGLSWTLYLGVSLALAAMTSAGMILFASRWQRLEAKAYGGAWRPWPVWALAGVLLVLWALGAADFALRSDTGRSWAGWVLVGGVPALWAAKSAALVFNAKGRAVVSNISEPRSWRRIGLVRPPIALVLAALTCFA